MTASRRFISRQRTSEPPDYRRWSPGSGARLAPPRGGAALEVDLEVQEVRVPAHQAHASGTHDPLRGQVRILRAANHATHPFEACGHIQQYAQRLSGDTTPPDGRNDAVTDLDDMPARRPVEPDAAYHQPVLEHLVVTEDVHGVAATGDGQMAGIGRRRPDVAVEGVPAGPGRVRSRVPPAGDHPVSLPPGQQTQLQAHSRILPDHNVREHALALNLFHRSVT